MSDIQLSSPTLEKRSDEPDSTIDVEAEADAAARRKVMYWVPRVVPLMAVMLASMGVLVLLQVGPS